MDANYTLSGLIDRIRAKLKDADYSESDIAQFINDSYFDILGEAHYQFLEKFYEATTQESGVLMLPMDFQTIIHLTATENNDEEAHSFIYKDPREFLSNNQGSPLNFYRYTVFGNKLFYGIPNVEEDLDNGEDDELRYYTIKLFYLAKPKKLVNPNDKPVIPAEFGEALLLGALARAEQLRDNFDYAAIYSNKQDELITNMKLRYCPRQMEGENRAKLPVFQRLRH